jgi:hypothetical protein
MGRDTSSLNVGPGLRWDDDWEVNERLVIIVGRLRHHPPSTPIACPVTKAASSEAR